jgi:hypothetical protein
MLSYLYQRSSSGWTLSKRCVVLPVRRRKTFTILAILLVCTMAAAFLECQVHAGSSADEHAAQHEHATPLGRHHSASPYTTGHGACLIAVLPTAMFLVWFTSLWLHVSFWFIRVIPHALLLFRPPRIAAQ